MITVTLIGPDDVQSVVTITGNVTVRDVVTAKYDLFSCVVKKNGEFDSPFTIQVVEGDSVTVEELHYPG